jgi:chromosome segregation ATPase
MIETPLMKLARSLFGGDTMRAVERQPSTENGLDLDHELFLLGTEQSGGGHRAAQNRLADHGGASISANRRGPPTRSAGALLPAMAGTERKIRGPQEPIFRAGFGNNEPRANCDYVEELDATLDADGRRWPTHLPAPRDSKNELENKIKELSAELNSRYIQIADLSNVRQQQDSELEAARDVINNIGKSVAALQDAIANHESEAAAAQQALARSKQEKTALAAAAQQALALSKQENAALRMQLEKTKKESATSLKHSLSVEVAFNDREVAIASARETIEFLRRDVAAKTMEASSLRATIKEENRRHSNELNRQETHFKIQIKKLEAMVAERDMRLEELDKTHSQLVERCNGLAKTVNALESTKRSAGEKTKYQNDRVERLETLLRVEREAAEIKIKDLTGELQRERLARSAAETRSVMAQNDIVPLSPKLAARRPRANEYEHDTSMSKNNAA